jgi:signal transduction histidine kinase
MTNAEGTMAILLIVTTSLAAASFWRLSNRFDVKNAPPLKRIALAIGWLAVGRIAAFVDLTFSDGPGHPLWLSAFVLPGMFFSAIFATATVRLRSRTMSPSLRYSATIIATGVVGVIWHTATERTFSVDDAGSIEIAVAAAHLIIDFLLLTSVLTLGAFASRLKGTPTRLVALGVIFYVASDMAYAVESLQGTYRFVSWTTLGALAGPLLVAIAPRLVTAESLTIQPTNIASDTWSLTYLPLGIMCVLQIVDVRDDPHQIVSLTIITVMVLLLIGRIQSYKKDVTSLNGDLSDSLDVRERELLRQQLLNDRIIGVAADGIVAVDIEDRVVLCNRAAREILAVPAGAKTPERLHDLFHPDPSCPGDCPTLDALHQSDRSMHELTLDINAEERVIELAVRALDGPEAGFVLVFHDVTDRARLARMKDRIVSVVSHEIRTPLTSIRGSLGLIDGGLMGQVSPEAKRMISIAVESSERLMRLINDLLDVERIESGRRTLNLSSTPMNALLADAVTVMQPIADVRSVEIEFDAPPETVLVDRDRILQVLTNLIQNAIKFSDPGSAIHLLGEKDSSHMTVTIRDEGHGIPASHIDAIFEPFHQVDISDSGPSSGSGLGLAICKEIVEAHGGTIWAERGIEQGAVFRFRIPIRDPHPFNAAATITSPNAGVS